MPNDIPWINRNFLALSDTDSSLDTASAVLLPVPYDSTESSIVGARNGPNAIIQSSSELEDYDIELDADISNIGIYTSPYLEPHMGSPELMAQRVQMAVEYYLDMGKTVGVLGGEHSVSIGSARAHQKYYPDSTVLYLDAHADLRNEYMGTEWGHAAGARRIHEQGNLVLVGVRSLCHEERLYIDSNDIKCVFWPSDDPSYMDNILEHLDEHDYLSVDLDVFDPSIMSAVGNPEPGGMNWQDVANLIKYISDNRKIVGFDVSELSPDHGPLSCSYTASKLVYKILAYACRDKC